MAYLPFQTSDRARSALGAAALTAALGAALLGGLGMREVASAEDSVAVFDVAPPAPPPPQAKRPAKRLDREAEGVAAPAGKRAEPTEIVAPPPEVLPPPTPTLVIAAPDPGTGSAPQAGAADVAGPGPGAGGIGNGRGSGTRARGISGGYDETPPRRIRGRLKNSDYPRGAGATGASGRVSVRYLVGTDGRVADCEVTQSSGSRILDETTCRLIRQRFRFRPSLDSRGRPVPATIIEDHEWIIEQLPPEPAP